MTAEPPYQLQAAWLETCAQSLGIRFYCGRISLEGSPVGDFVYAVFRSRLWGNRLISLPFSDGSGLSLRGAGLAGALAGFLDREAAARGLDYAEIRGEVPWDQGEGSAYFTRVEPYVTFRLDLLGGYEQVRRGFSANIRENLRKAQRGVEVAELGRRALPEDLYRMYLSQMRRFGSPPLPPAYFSGLLTSGLGRLFTARIGGRPAAFLLAFVCGGRMLAEINAGLSEYDSWCPKVRLFDHAIRTACSEGLSQFDFMRTRRGSGVYEHKRKWGGVETPIPYHLRVFRGRAPGILDPEQGRFLLPRLAFRCLPLSWSARLGPPLRAWIGK